MFFFYSASLHRKIIFSLPSTCSPGSANINDRSMLGSKDSELAVFVEDEERVSSIMGGEEYQAGPLTLALRKECFRSGQQESAFITFTHLSP